jgi:hypothetical protein
MVHPARHRHRRPIEERPSAIRFRFYGGTQDPKESFPVRTGGHMVGSVYLGLLFYIGFGGFVLWSSIRDMRELWREGYPLYCEQDLH